MTDQEIKEATEEYYRVKAEYDELESFNKLKPLVDLGEAHLNTPKNWPEKKEITTTCSCYGDNNKILCLDCVQRNITREAFNNAINACKSAAMKGCPCCGVARIVEVKSKQE